ncbi:MAG: hypothetical protein J1D86_01480 [Alistipes sp.]|nr:hypothetical protein [Alistipes sp.]
MKKLLFISLFAALLAAGCSKEEPTKDVEIELTQMTKISELPETVTKIMNSKEYPLIRTIYIVPLEGTWSDMRSNNILIMRNKVLQPTIELSPKVRGKGDFNFGPGEASKVPEDSLWYVQHGWTINKRFLENK